MKNEKQKARRTKGIRGEGAQGTSAEAVSVMVSADKAYSKRGKAEAFLSKFIGVYRHEKQRRTFRRHKTYLQWETYRQDYSIRSGNIRTGPTETQGDGSELHGNENQRGDFKPK